MTVITRAEASTVDALEQALVGNALSGELDGFGSDEQEEAARDLLRCREDIRADLLRAASALEVSPASRPSLHRDEEGVDHPPCGLAAGVPWP